jgi:DNA-binding PadR family transcriptional regulator
MGGRHRGGHWGRMGPGWGMESEGRRGRSRRRMFDGGELRLVLLKLIADEPRHGYDLIREIEELTQGAYAPSPGIVYPTLTMLEDMDLIAEQRSEGAKKQFAATEAGQAHLAERTEEVAALMARLTELGEARTRSDSTSIRRAMGNLRQVLMDKLSGEIEPETLHELVALIDEAAQKIERL